MRICLKPCARDGFDLLDKLSHRHRRRECNQKMDVVRHTANPIEDNIPSFAHF